MHTKDDLSDILVEEVLTDVANNFFGERKYLEDTIAILHEYVDVLKLKEKKIAARAAFINYLLITEKNAEAFYRSLSLPLGLFLSEGKISSPALPAYPPTALTLKGEYIKLVNWAYESLQKSCRHYMNGCSEGLSDSSGGNESDANYKLIDSMCYIINEKIDQVNQQMAPGQVLQYVKRFDHDARSRERMTGGGSFYGDDCSLNCKLAYRHIDCCSLLLTQYPQLPPPAKASRKISDACKKLWNSHSIEMKKRLKQVKKMCQESAH